MSIHSTRSSFLCGTALAAGLLAPGLAFAAEGNVEGVVVQSQAQGPALDVVSTAGSRLGLTPLETPAAVTVVSGELLRGRGDLTLIDAISRAPGITAGATVGNGNSFVAMRGFYGSTSIIYTYNGILLRLAGNTAVFPFDPWNVERLEVLSGPASVLYGTGGIGGAINVVTKDPDPNKFHSEIEFMAGSYETYHEAIDLTGPLNEKWSYRLNVSNRSSQGFVPNARSRSLAMSAALRYQAASNLVFTLSEDYGDQHLSPYEGSVISNNALVEPLRKVNYNVAGAFIINTTSLTALRAEWSPSDAVKVSNYAYFTNIKRPFFDATAYTYLPATQQVRITSFRNLDKQYGYQYGDSGNATVNAPLFGLKNEIVVGFDVNKAHYTRADNAPTGGFQGTFTVSAFNYIPIQFTQGNSPIRQPHFDSELNQAGLFGEDRLSLTNQFSLVGGLRYDHLDSANHDLEANTIATTRQNNLTGHIGAVYEIAPKLAVYAQYAMATDPVANLASITLAQQTLKTATGREYEAGLKQSLWNDRFSWTFAAYQITKKNILTPSLANPTVSEQVGQQSARGLEATIALNLGKVDIGANGTILRAKFDNFVANVAGKPTQLAGNLPVFVPQNSANLWGSWNFLPDWQVRGEVRYVGKRFTDTINTQILPSYTVAGLGLRWTPSDQHWQIDLRVDNVTNATYAASANSGTQWVLGQPRSYSVKVNYVF